MFGRGFESHQLHKLSFLQKNKARSRFKSGFVLYFYPILHWQDAWSLDAFKAHK